MTGNSDTVSPSEEESRATSGQRARSPSWVLSDTALLLGIVVLAIGARLYAVSEYDVSTMLGIVTAVGPVNVALGAAVPLLPYLFVFTTAAFVSITVVRPTIWTLIASVVVASLTIVVSPAGALHAPLILCSVIGGIVIGITIGGHALEPRHPVFRQRDWLILGTVAALAIGMGALSTEMWLPTERIALADTGSVEGFVIGETDDVLTVLESGSRTLLRLPSEQIESRTVCTDDAGEGSRVSILESLRGQRGLGDSRPECAGE